MAKKVQPKAKAKAKAPTVKGKAKAGELILLVKSIKKETSVQDNETFFDVCVQLFDDAGELLVERRLGFPLHTTQDEMLAELAKFKKTYKSDMTGMEKNAAFDALHAEADKVISNVEGKEL